VPRWRRRDQIVVETERLVLRPLEPSDYDDFVGCVDAEVRRWQGWPVYDQQYFRQWFQLALAGRLRHLPLNLAVTERAHGRCVGCYSVMPTSSDSAQLGWWLGASARGRGFGGESLPAVLAYTEQRLRFSRVVMGTSADNVRAIAMITGAGGVRTHGNRHPLPNGVVADAIWFAHLKPGVER
jgi:RimJ/RimL family protein N-acetyltransferase